MYDGYAFIRARYAVPCRDGAPVRYNGPIERYNGRRAHVERVVVLEYVVIRWDDTGERLKVHAFGELDYLEEGRGQHD